MESQQKIQIGALLRRFFMFTEPNRGTVFMYNLNGNPPCIIAKTPEMNWRIEADGKAFLVAGCAEVPAPGNPFPRELATLQAALAFRRIVPVLPWALLAIIAPVVIQFLLWNLPDAPTDELRLNFISLLSMWMNTALIVGLCLCAVTLLIWNFGKGVRVSMNPMDNSPMLLESGEPDISPDIFLMSDSPGENPDKYLDRWAAAEAGQKPGQWIVVITFRRPEGVIVTGTEEPYRFVRDCPDYQGRDWPVEERIVPPGTRFSNETWEQYLNYCHTFATHYPEWAKWQKIDNANAIEAMKESLRAEAKINKA